MLRSRTLTELTRQINSRTKNGHAPPYKKSWKDFNLSILLTIIRSWWVFPCWVELSRKFHSWLCSSVNSFKFQPCDHRLIQYLSILGRLYLMPSPLSHYVLATNFYEDPLPFSLWTASMLGKIPSLGLGCGLSIVHLYSFYHTLGHYPGHIVCFHLYLVYKALGTSRNLIVSLC